MQLCDMQPTMETPKTKLLNKVEIKLICYLTMHWILFLSRSTFLKFNLQPECLVKLLVEGPSGLVQVINYSQFVCIVMSGM